MGKFINTNSTRSSISDMINQAAQSKLQNPYYLFNDKRATEVNYYNLNVTRTTLDEAVRTNYGELDAESPLRFNKVSGFYLYGITQIQPSLEVAEYGLEASDITGEALVMPNTLVPYPGDFFYIPSITSGTTYMFKVTAVNPNTLDTGATMYKINYCIAYTDGRNGDIENQVVKTYKFVADNVGTNASCLIEEDTYDAAVGLEEYTTTLKDYYIGLFYDSKVQSFVYNRQGSFFNVYDPYLVEFLIRNEILKGSTEYMYIQQQMYLPNTFNIDYARTFFYSLEQCDMTTHIGSYIGNLYYVDQKLSLLYAYPIDYYYMEYARMNIANYTVNIFDDPAFNTKIKNNDQSGDSVLKNIVIGYFNGETVTDDQLSQLKHLDYLPTVELFYLIPMVIYIFEQTISSLLETDDSDSTTTSTT